MNKIDSKIKVELLYHTQDPSLAVATAARLCYSSSGASDLHKHMKAEQAKKVLSTILASGHDSTLEHASYTFAIEGISRACSHQLVRHRMASFNQQSQRYVKSSEKLDTIVPDTIKRNPEAHKVFEDTVEKIEKAYAKMVKEGIPAEDARYILPNAAETKIVVTMNIRELKHFFSLRCCNRAQWEIRELAWKMFKLVEPTAPFIFADSGPECVRTKCREGKMSCGKPYPRVDRSKL